MSVERMPNPAALVPETMRALTELNTAISRAGVDRRLLALTRLRASQINGCGPGVAEGARLLRAAGAPVEQADTVAAWRVAPYFSAGDRAALALTEAVTRLADHPDPVPDEVWDLAAKHFDQKELAVLLLSIAVTNTFNRLTVATRQQAMQR